MTLLTESLPNHLYDSLRFFRKAAAPKCGRKLELMPPALRDAGTLPVMGIKLNSVPVPHG
jgi:hypothetical protein